MIDWLLQSNVFYPSSICVFALCLVFFSRKTDPNGWLKLMSLGLAVTLGALGLSLLFGLSPEEIPKALTFEGGALSGLRKLVALGYIFFLAGFLLMLRSLVSRALSSRKASRS